MMARLTLIVAITTLTAAAEGTYRAPEQTTGTAAQRTVAVDTGNAISRVIAARRHPSMRWPALPDVALELRGIYEARTWAPLWFRGGRPTPVAASVVRMLAAAATHGLRPGDYDAGTLAERLAAAAAAPLPDEQAELADVALTADLIRFARALRFGRIPPTVVHAALHLPRDTMNVAAFVTALAALTGPGPDAWVRGRLDALEPPWTHYRLLLQTLARYRALAADTAAPRPSGLTRARVTRRVEQIELALERWRWLPHAFAAPPIFINIPAFRLYAFPSGTDDERAMLAMNVAVGRAYRWRTPVFSATLRTVVFSPYWDVPPSIAAGEVLPKARRNLGYLTRENMEIVTVPSGTLLPLTRVSLARVAAGTARVRQRPGPRNSLGGVKFVFPNDFNVYLHDTPVRSAFALDRRDVSHGCIRVEEPARLAAFVLRGQPEWTAARIDSAMHLARPLSVAVATPVPVFIVYSTAATRADGEALFYDDIYGHDRTLARVLARGYPYE